MNPQAALLDTTTGFITSTGGGLDPSRLGHRARRGRGALPQPRRAGDTLEDSLGCYHRLEGIAQSIEDNHPREQIASEIQRLAKGSLEHLPRRRAMLYHSFLESFHSKLYGHRDGEHIYLRRYQTPQINLFENLIRHYLPISLVQNHVNDSISDMLRWARRAAIVDVGIGTGLQMINAIRRIRVANPYLEELTVIGVEPFHAALQEAETQLRMLSGEGPRIDFVPMHAFVEEMDVSDIASSIPDSAEVLVVNASFTLHHIRTFEQRLAVLKGLQKLLPDLLLLSEPNVDHGESRFSQRFRNCFQHFSQAFELIDSLPISTVRKRALKLFFCREIEDIVASPEADRVERHAPMDDWLEMLSLAGFQPVRRDSERPSLPTARLGFHWHPGGYWGVDLDAETLLGVVSATVRNGTAAGTSSLTM